MVKFNPYHILQKLRTFLKQGTSPKHLAASTSLGIFLGIFPMLGVTTWVSTAIALRWKLNLPLMLTLLYLVWPIQVALIIPFLRLGEWLCEVPAFPLSLDKLLAAFEADFFGAVKKFWDANLYAIAGWIVVAVPLGLLFYFLLSQIFRRAMRKKEAGSDSKIEVAKG